MKDVVAWVRRIFLSIGITPKEPPCTQIAADGTCTGPEKDEDWIHDAAARGDELWLRGVALRWQWRPVPR